MYADDKGIRLKIRPFLGPRTPFLPSISTTANKKNFGDLHWRIAYALDKQGRYSEAENWYRKSIPIFASIGDQESVASLHNNLAGVLEEKGKLKKAEMTYRKALQIAEKLQSEKQQQRAKEGLNRLTKGSAENLGKSE